MSELSLELDRVGLVRGGRPILDDVTWRVEVDQRWVVLGPNGSGKTTVVRIAGLLVRPSSGRVRVLGQEVGRTDVRRLRPRIGLASQALADGLRPDLTALDVVLTGRHAALAPWWHRYEEADRALAASRLERLGVGPLSARAFGTLSSGERQRVQLARTLMAEPELLLLDEPTAGLDLAGREDLVRRLDSLAADPTTPPTVLVTHHVEEIPPSFTHVLLLREGRVLAAGPLPVTLTAEALSSCFGLPLAVERRNGRWWAYG
jgi:iron complex transport system ATP-binding protein